MPVLRDPKREKFAQLLARGLGATEAYERAGYHRNSGNAATMRKRKDVQERVDEIQKGFAQSSKQALKDYLDDSGVDEAYIIKQLIDVGQEAKKAGKFTDAINAFKEVGKECFHMFLDKKNQNSEDNDVQPKGPLAVQDFSAVLGKLTQAFERPSLDGTFVRIDDTGTFVPVGNKQDYSD